MVSELAGVFVGAVALGAIHGIEPGHGWPVAASYALDKSNKWIYGLAASSIIGIGHLISSIAMVGVFFYAKGYFNLTQVNEPITVFNSLEIGGPVSLVAGVLLILLGMREYRHGHSHSHGGMGDHSHGQGGQDHGHSHGDDHAHDGDGDGHAHVADADIDLAAVRKSGSEHGPGATGGHHDHDETHDHGGSDVPDRGLLGIAWFAFVLGVAHVAEFEIIALRAGSDFCLELMGAYALTVIAGIVTLTMLLIAGYEHSQERVEQYTPYLPAFSAAVLSIMGVGFILGLF
jgi:ABC-type nickel/cobalt efflux system permease component RcnA